MEANTNADPLKEMQLREKTLLQEQVNELQGQLEELKGENFWYKTRIEKLETEQKNLQDRIHAQEQYSRKDTWTFVTHHSMRNAAKTYFSTLSGSLKNISG